MRRRGELNVLGNTFIQVLIAAAIVGMIWFPFASKALDGEIFYETAYATDNALIADTLLAIPSGTTILSYPLVDEAYTIQLREGSIRFTNARRKGVGVERMFGTDEEITIQETTFTPRMYEWKKTDTELSINLQTYSQLCPEIPEAPAWKGERATYSGEAMAARILEEVTTRITRGTGGATHLTINWHKGDSVIITTGNQEEYLLLSCYVVEELLENDVEPIELRENQEQTNMLIIEIPERIPPIQASRQLEPAIRKAYERLLN